MPTLSSFKKTLIHSLPGPSYGKWELNIDHCYPMSVTQSRLHNLKLVIAIAANL